MATISALPGSPIIPQNIHIQIVFSLLQNAFVKFYIYICLNCKVYLIHLNYNMYFSKTGMCIYPNCEMYLHNSFNLTTICALPWITSNPQPAQTYFTSSKNSNGRGNNIIKVSLLIEGGKLPFSTFHSYDKSENFPAQEH